MYNGSLLNVVISIQEADLLVVDDHVLQIRISHQTVYAHLRVVRLRILISADQEEYPL